MNKGVNRQKWPKMTVGCRHAWEKDGWMPAKGDGGSKKGGKCDTPPSEKARGCSKKGGKCDRGVPGT